MTHRPPAAVACCAPTRCHDRVEMPDGGWACRTALRSGRLAWPAVEIDRGVDRIAARSAGWSRGVTLPCPACGCRAYSPGPGGLPERRCWACHVTWNPEAAEMAARRSA